MRCTDDTWQAGEAGWGVCRLWRRDIDPLQLHNSFIEEMLADPMIQLVMKADGVTDAEIRRLYCVTPPAVRHQAWASDPVRE